MLSIGIVGLPNVGKSTLFEALTKKQVARENYPFCTIDPNVGVVLVKDERLDKLAELLKSAKKIESAIEFLDIAGLVKGSAQGQGLGNQFLAHIREASAILYILRAFQSTQIINTQDSVDALREKEILDKELILKDLETINKHLTEAQKLIKTHKESLKQVEALSKAKALLEKDFVLSEVNPSASLCQTLRAGLAEEEIFLLKPFCLLTLKRRIYLLNGSESEVSPDGLKFFQAHNLPYLIIDVLTELEAGDLTKEERLSFGLKEVSSIDDLIKKAYEALDLITFFTAVSQNEIRAWPLKNGLKAPQAGGMVHSDFEQHFIKAEVINWQDLLKAGGFNQAKAKGLLRTEGKDYIVQDGDVIEIKSGR